VNDVVCLVRAVQAGLAARGYPAPVRYAERYARTGNAPGYVVTARRDHAGGDAVTSVSSPQRNPKRQRVRQVGVEFRVYASASVSGATRGEHEDEADKLVDAIIVEIDKWCVENQRFLPDYVEARFLADEERDDGERGAGAVYLFRVRFGRGVLERDYDGGAKSTGTIASVNASLIVNEETIE